MLTGGAGFIGSHIADLIIKEGHQVIIIDNLLNGKKANINSAASFYHLDIRDKSLEEVFAQERPDVLNHHAAQVSVRDSVTDPIYDLEINVRGTVHLLELSRKYGVKKVIFASSGGAIYGEQDYFPADEKHPLRPLSPYGAAKLAGESYLYYYQQIFDLPYIALRYANVYGPRQNPFGEAGVVAIFANKLLRNENPTINGDGEQTRDYVFVEDVVKANVTTLRDENSDIFNVGTSIETSVNELFASINLIAGGKAEEKHGPAPKGEQARSVITSDKLLQRFNWKPSIKIDEGLKKTFEFFKSNI